ncbi:unnamed protein product, partial [Sphagnum balticum]
DSNLFWNSISPQFTSCFRWTVIPLIPLALLLLTVPYDIYFASKKWSINSPPVRWRWKSVTYLVLILSSMTVSVIDLTESLTQFYSNEVNLIANIFSPSIQLFTYLMILIFFLLFRKHLTQTVSQPIFWLTNLLCLSLIYWMLIMDNKSNVLDFQLSITAIILSVIGLILSCISDIKSQLNYELLENERSNIDLTQPHDEDYCPRENTNVFSRLTYSWMYGFLWKGLKTQLEMSHLEPLCSYMRPTQGARIFIETYKRRNEGKKKTRIIPTIFKTGWVTLLASGCIGLAQVVFTFGMPYMIGHLLDFVKTGNTEPTWHGLMYAIGYCSCCLIARILGAYQLCCVEMTSVRINSALTSVIYRKMLKLSPSSRRKYTAGEINNFFGVDVDQICAFVNMANALYVGPLNLIISIYILWQILGPSALTLFAVLLILSPATSFIMSKTEAIWKEYMQFKDKRIEKLSEILNNMKMLKLFAWENPFMEQVNNIRKNEVGKLLKNAYWSSGIDLIWSMSPIFVAAACFTVYILGTNGVFDAKTAFVSLSVFNILRPFMAIFPDVTVKIIRANVSSKRIREFLDAEELDEQVNRFMHESMSNRLSNNDDAVSIKKATFCWELNEEPNLREIDIKVQKGSLVAIVGRIGSGKSSLFSAIMGEMYQTKGEQITLDGRLAYVPQTAWIQNCTIKKNVIFTSDFNEEKYKKVISACALEPDLEILPGKDETEIGEKGINLSGGQKQRVSLARAVYQDSDVYLLDDPLSAVDAHVASHLFEKVIGPQGLLKDKTRLLATHHISFLRNVDSIIVMNHGEIIGQGKFDELYESGLLSEDVFNNDESEETEDVDDESIDRQISSVSKTSRRMSEASYNSGKLNEGRISRASTCTLESKRSKETETQLGHLIDDENQTVGFVKASNYINYVKQCGFLFITLAFLAELGYNVCEVGAKYWLNIWTSKPGNYTMEQRAINIAIFSSAVLFEAVFIVLGNIFMCISGIIAAKKIHKDMLFSVLRSPLSFFDTTPMGRIVNRFNSDLQVIDESIPTHLKFVFGQYMMFPLVFSIFFKLSPYLFLLMIIISFIFYFTYKFYLKTKDQLSRLSSTTKSPIYSHFSESISGSTSIRAYNVQKYFEIELENKVITHSNASWNGFCANNWLEIWSGFISALMTFSMACYIAVHRKDVSQGFAGLVLIYIIMLVDSLNWAVIVSSWLNQDMISVERVLEYSNLNAESDWESKEDFKPSTLWPTNGKIDFVNYSTIYREGLDPVLKNLSVTIKGGEKVGVVGRTGAGKSSMTLALFRIIEPTSGTIIIDGVDVTKIGLHDLRSKLTIIPQEPSLFAGPLRINLDPFHNHSDEQLWTSLENAHLKEFISSLPEKLEHTLTDGGDNLSAGQRQLVCLARALLRKSKILILDEATAACDIETDKLIQGTIREKFSHCTIITIAHRLHTVLDYDRIFVLDQGQLVEVGKPQELLDKTDSIFYALAKEAGI